eukprot:403338697
MRLSHKIAFQSPTLALILEYLLQVERVQMQQLCTTFYHKTIPQKLTPQTTSFLKYDPNYTIQYLGEKRLFRIKISPQKLTPGQTYIDRVYWLPVNKLWDVQVESNFLNWNYELIKNPQKLKIDKVFRVEDSFYLYERNENETIIHKLNLFTFVITKIATLKIPYYFGAGFGVIQGRYIMQAGGYLYKQVQQMFGNRVHNTRTEYTFEYNLEFQVFDCFSGKFLNSKRFGKLNKGRHGCGIIERKNKVYIIGGVQYSSKQKKVFSSYRVEVLNFKNPTGLQLKEVEMFKFCPPNIVTFCACFNDDYVFMTGYQINKENGLPKYHDKPEINLSEEYTFQLHIKDDENNFKNNSKYQLSQGKQQQPLLSIRKYPKLNELKFEYVSKQVTKEVEHMKSSSNYQDILVAGKQVIATNYLGHINVSYQPQIEDVQNDKIKFYYIPASNVIKNLNPAIFQKPSFTLYDKKPADSKLKSKEKSIVEEIKEQNHSKLKGNQQKHDKMQSVNLKNEFKSNLIQKQIIQSERLNSSVNQSHQDQGQIHNQIAIIQSEQQNRITSKINSSVLTSRQQISRPATATVNIINKLQSTAQNLIAIRDSNIVSSNRPQTATIKPSKQSMIKEQQKQD